MITPKFPDAVLDTTTISGNAFAVMSEARRAMSRVGATQADLDAYSEAAMAEDFDNLLRVTMQWVTVE